MVPDPCFAGRLPRLQVHHPRISFHPSHPSSASLPSAPTLQLGDLPNGRFPAAAGRETFLQTQGFSANCFFSGNIPLSDGRSQSFSSVVVHHVHVCFHHLCRNLAVSSGAAMQALVLDGMGR